jgi:prolyl 4-hydroxylase
MLVNNRAWRIDNFMTAERCKQIIADSIDHPFIRKDDDSRSLWRYVHPNNSQLYEELHETTQSQLQKIIKKDQSIIIDPNVRLLRYEIGDFMNEHRDISRNDSEYSVVVYLNDDYDGGHLEFIDCNIDLKPSIGDAIVFKQCDYGVRHRVTPIIQGTKHVLRMDVACSHDWIDDI